MNRVLTALILSIGAWSLTACSAGTPLTIALPSGVQKEEKVYRGVVNGLWRYDPKENTKRLTSSLGGASVADAQSLASRYQVRVGIDRSWWWGKFSEVVALPEGWTYSLQNVVNDSRTVNIGDIVDIRTEAGKGFETLIRIVRKCDEQPEPDENHDWNIGCKSVDAFGSNGYAGEVYYLTVF
jgi:hypothetical protein